MRRLLLAAALASGCIQATWTRESSEEPITGVMTAPLRPGLVNLSQCLDRLGAPLLVWETRGGGYMLVYAWRDDVGWALRVTIPVARFVNANFRYSELDREAPSVALFFDMEDRMLQIQRGRLGQFMAAYLVELDDDPDEPGQ